MQAANIHSNGWDSQAPQSSHCPLRRWLCPAEQSREEHPEKCKDHSWEPEQIFFKYCGPATQQQSGCSFQGAFQNQQQTLLNAAVCKPAWKKP